MAFNKKPALVVMPTIHMKRLVLVAVCVAFFVISSCQSIKPVPVVPFIEENSSMLYEPLEYRFGDSTNVVIVPDGFVTDFASIPRPFWSIFAPNGRCKWAAVVHDYLYWEQQLPRAKADEIFLCAMEESGVGFAERRTIYTAVRAAGEAAWKQNARERKVGLPRIIPKAFRNIPGNTTWAEYRQTLFAAGVRP